MASVQITTIMVLVFMLHVNSGKYVGMKANMKMEVQTESSKHVEEHKMRIPSKKDRDDKKMSTGVLSSMLFKLRTYTGETVRKEKLSLQKHKNMRSVQPSYIRVLCLLTKRCKTPRKGHPEQTIGEHLSHLISPELNKHYFSFSRMNSLHSNVLK